jgi:hypothetical protein
LTSYKKALVLQAKAILLLEIAAAVDDTEAAVVAGLDWQLIGTERFSYQKLQTRILKVKSYQKIAHTKLRK